MIKWRPRTLKPQLMTTNPARSIRTYVTSLRTTVLTQLQAPARSPDVLRHALFYTRMTHLSVFFVVFLTSSLFFSTLPFSFLFFFFFFLIIRPPPRSPLFPYPPLFR